MERAPAPLKHACVGDLVGERVLERVLEIGKEARLVQELGGLEVAQFPAKIILGRVRDGL